jgi:phospholipid transport system substrate-binding protein
VSWLIESGAFTVAVQLTQSRMVMSMNTPIISTVSSSLGRRSLLGMALIASAPLGWPAIAQTTSDPTETITRFNAALLAAMRAGGRTDFTHRFQMLAPAVDQAFDLPAVLSVSVGLGWSAISPDQQGRLLDAFRRYTIASYVANFDTDNGQTFSVSPDPRNLSAGQVMVKSRIVPVNGDPAELDYVLQQTASGWKIVDVLAAGSISRVAVQRSDFRHLLSRGGGDALLASLQRKTNDLSGGALA